jgi:hypothetical protein
LARLARITGSVVASGLALVAIGALASYLPARRTARIEPR